MGQWDRILKFTIDLETQNTCPHRKEILVLNFLSGKFLSLDFPVLGGRIISVLHCHLQNSGCAQSRGQRWLAILRLVLTFLGTSLELLHHQEVQMTHFTLREEGRKRAWELPWLSSCTVDPAESNTFGYSSAGVWGLKCSVAWGTCLGIRRIWTLQRWFPLG